MAISRIKVWVDGNVLTAADLNNEFNNILANAIPLISPFTSNVDAGLNQITNLVLEKRTGGPAVVTTGRIYFDTVYNSIRVGAYSTSISGYISPFEGIGRPIGLQGSLISNIGSFAAESYTLSLVGNQQVISMTATSSFTINTQTPGPLAGGRDQAAAFASTDVHFYAVADGIRSTVVYGVCSSKPPKAFSASGFAFWAYLCSAKYDVAASAVLPASGHIVKGSRIYPDPEYVLVLNGAATSETSIPLNVVMPGIATQYTIAVNNTGPQVAGAGTGVTYSLSLHSSPAAQGRLLQTDVTGVAPLATFRTISAEVTFPNTVQSSPALSYNHIISVGTSALASLNLVSYQVPNGDG